MAYDKDLDIVAAEEWLKQRRSHKGSSGTMDAVLEDLYFPNGRESKSADEEVDDIEDYDAVATNIDIEVAETMPPLSLNQDKVISSDESDHSDDYIYGEENDYINDHTVVYDDGVDVNLQVEP